MITSWKEGISPRTLPRASPSPSPSLQTNSSNKMVCSFCSACSRCSNDALELRTRLIDEAEQCTPVTAHGAATWGSVIISHGRSAHAGAAVRAPWLRGRCVRLTLCATLIYMSARLSLCVCACGRVCRVPCVVCVKSSCVVLISCLLMS